MLEPVPTSLPDVQLWCCDLDDPRVLAHCDECFLAPDELPCAERLRSKRHRQLFLRRRALRRFLLGRFLKTPPQKLSIEETKSGKPQFTASSTVRCEFSTSHAENLFAMAIAPELEVGVDVEVLRPEWNVQLVAAMCLGSSQIRQLENFPAQERQEQFLRFWSLREAFAKATGDGIAQSAPGHISTTHVWDCALNAKPPPQGWNWIQQWHRIGKHESVISVVQKIPAASPSPSAKAPVRRAD